jgi:hypothetical protein
VAARTSAANTAASKSTVTAPAKTTFVPKKDIKKSFKGVVVKKKPKTATIKDWDTSNAGEKRKQKDEQPETKRQKVDP